MRAFVSRFARVVMCFALVVGCHVNAFCQSASASSRLLTTDNRQLTTLSSLPPFERAVVLIKHFETLHRPCHWPTIGYGHVVQAGEPYRKGIQLSAKQADALLRHDLHKFCSMFSYMGKDSLLLGVLAYNVGPYRLLGTSTTPKSRLLAKLEVGNRDILIDYLSYNRYQGHHHSGLQRRRLLEYHLLFKKE